MIHELRQSLATLATLATLASQRNIWKSRTHSHNARSLADGSCHQEKQSFGIYQICLVTMMYLSMLSALNISCYNVFLFLILALTSAASDSLLDRLDDLEVVFACSSRLQLSLLLLFFFSFCCQVQGSNFHSLSERFCPFLFIYDSGEEKSDAILLRRHQNHILSFPLFSFPLDCDKAREIIICNKNILPWNLGILLGKTFRCFFCFLEFQREELLRQLFVCRTQKLRNQRVAFQ